jgi:hypothetical protein
MGDHTLRALASQCHEDCAWVVGDSLGGNVHLGCKSITVSNDPVGAYDSATGVSGGIRVGGWGIDPDTDNPLQVHVYRDGVFAGAYTANISRPDVVSSTGPFPGFSTNHGFNFVVPSTPGAHSVCLWIIGVTPGAANQGLGCRSATAS